MKHLLFAAVITAAALLAPSVLAQQPPPAPQPPQQFLPITVTESDYKILSTYLMDAVPKKYADQILLWIDSLEVRAQQEKAKAEEAAKPKDPAPAK